MRTRKIAFGGLILMLAACAGDGAGPVLSSGDRYARETDLAADYKLGVADRIKISVFNEPTLSGEFTVSAGGTVSLPLIGEVPAVDRTVRDVADEAQRRLADGYLRRPQVAAEVLVYRPFFIFGEVGSAGQYPYAAGMTAMNAIALARGFTPRADREKVRIQRKGESAESTYRLTPELLVYPGDIIRVGERFF